MKNILINGSILILFFLTSCDPGVSYKKIIENNSDYDLLFIVYQDSLKNQFKLLKKDSFLIYKHNEDVLYEYTSLGQTKDFENCDIYCDSVIVKVLDNDSLQLNLDIVDELNWDFSVLEKTYKGGGTCECRMKINNDMIK